MKQITTDDLTQLEADFLALANEYLDLVEGGSYFEKAYEILQRYDIVDEEGFRK